MKIASAASAFPKNYYSQKVLLERLQDYWGAQLKNPLLLARLHRNVTVDGRYLAIPAEQYADIKTWGEANDIWIKVAQELGEQALCLALHNAGMKPQDLGALLFTTVTGVASPSIDALLINRMGLPANIRRTPIFGLGCVAGAAGIARAYDYVRAYPSQAAALVSVELCSLTLQREDLSVANLISSGLFADGAAAVIVTGENFASSNGHNSGPTILATRSIFYPATEEMMGWNISEKGFRIILSTEVPNPDSAKSWVRTWTLFWRTTVTSEAILRASFCTPVDPRCLRLRRRRWDCTTENWMPPGIVCAKWEIFLRLPFCVCWRT
jgi:alkylresorcinol/alkylpyrone synthase